MSGLEVWEPGTSLRRVSREAPTRGRSGATLGPRRDCYRETDGLATVRQVRREERRAGMFKPEDC